MRILERRGQAAMTRKNKCTVKGGDVVRLEVVPEVRKLLKGVLKSRKVLQ